MSENERTESDALQVEGLLDIIENKSGVLLDPARGGKTTPNDPFLPKELIRRFKLKRGSFIQADAIQNPNRPSPKVRFIHTVDGLSIKDRKSLFRFDQLTTIQPKEKLNIECKDGRMTTRMIDLFCPIGKGQRGLIVAPPRAGKTTILHDIAKGIEENLPSRDVGEFVENEPEDDVQIRAR